MRVVSAAGHTCANKLKCTPQVYRAGIDPKFPDGGKMSCHLDSLQVGDTIEAKGPMGHVTYLARGK